MFIKEEAGRHLGNAVGYLPTAHHLREGTKVAMG